MKLSIKAEYGLRAILEVAKNQNGNPLRLKDIAQRQNISAKYLEQLMTILKTAGFVRTSRGSKGGYTLAKSANQIKISEIFNTLEGPITTAECIENKNFCANATDCVIRQIWQQVHQAMTDVLQSITLQDLVDKSEIRKGSSYQI
jgi:Rrf2 family transcriptional regulator, cysteine metabolism repressor